VPTPRARRVGILAFTDAEILDVTGPLDVFATANAVLASARRAKPGYVVELLAPRAGRVRTWAGLELGPARAFASAGALDTLLVAGGSRDGVLAARRTRGLLAWLRRRARGTRRVGSVCTGALVLAASGVLDGRRATTHWSALEWLRTEHPRVEVEPDALFVRDGNLFTAAGVTAGIDLALALVEEDHGRRVALAVARQLVVFLKRPGGQAQFSGHLAAQAARGDRFDTLLAWLVENPAADLSVPALAARAAMSERNFARAFVRELGATPAKLVERIRLDHARRLLEESDEPLKRVADAAGFGTPETLRRALARHIGIGPEAYRARFAVRAARASTLTARRAHRAPPRAASDSRRSPSASRAGSRRCVPPAPRSRTRRRSRSGSRRPPP